MARTYRRRKKTDLTEKFHYCQYDLFGGTALPKNCKEYAVKENKYHSDKFKPIVTRHAKEAAKKSLRAYTKSQLSKVYCGNYEDFDFDKSKDKVILHYIMLYN